MFGSYKIDILSTSRLLLISVLLISSYQVQATHNRAGEITYEQIDALTIRATITTYTKTSSFAADRDSLEMFWGDGTSEFVARSNDQGEALENDIKVNYYIAEHTYPTRGTYTIGTFDPNRIAGILNIDFPNSVNITFYVETTFTLLNTQFQGNNSSVILLQPPIDQACVGEVFVHNPNAYDPDGDSLSYEFAVPFQNIGEEVPNYLFPDEVTPGPDNMLTLNPVTGEIRWESPQTQGEVNLTLRINEYRQGVLINSLVRDMQISVTTCVNESEPPTLDGPDEICVVAGEEVTFDIIGDDMGEGQLILLSATGGPFELESSPATFSTLGLYSPPTTTGTFNWQTNCNHVSDKYYQVVFKVVDNSIIPDGLIEGLATLKTVRILVTAPAPEDLEASVQSSNVQLTWTSPYDCEVTDNEYFRGFSVWRKNNSSQVPIDTCAPGLEGHGYQKIIFLTKEIGNRGYTVLDLTTERGNIYCYRILAEFAQLSSSGNPFNIVESLRSDEVCVELLQDRPLVTNVSINNTSSTDGSIEIEWVPPIPKDVDTIANPGPYQLVLLRSGGGGFEEVASFDFASFADNIELFYLDTDLNTSSNGYTYRMDFHVNGESEVYSSSPEASSIYINAAASDNRVNLTWRESVPWSNYEYDVLRLNDNNGYDTLATVTGRNYSDTEAVNGEEECYKIISYGTYGIDRVPQDLINLSQEQCASPVDTVAPCLASGLRVTNICDNTSAGVSENFVNTLNWTLDIGCGRESDVRQYNVYYATSENDDFYLLESINASITSFTHSPSIGLAGCYSITTVDAVGNESAFSNIVCLDNCPEYELANTFTPNNDGANDMFVPRVNRFIESVDFRVYNKWGQVVYETTDPMLRWEGKNQGGKDLAQATYYYTVQVFERRLDGIFEQDRIRSGYVTIIR